METDLVVVGGGPAGISAATAAAQHGVRVALVDEQPSLGGRLRGLLHEKRNSDGAGAWTNGPALSARMEVEAQEAGVQILSGRGVWGIWPGWVVYLDGVDDPQIRARALILATGSTERSYVLPNWTLPGVLTAGAVQSLLHVYRVRPGDSAVMIGADASAVLVARELMLAGVRVSGVLLPPPGTPGGPSTGEAIQGLARFKGTAASLELDRVGQLLSSKTGIMSPADFPQSGLEAFNVPIMLRCAVTAIIGETRVTAVEVVDLTADGEPTGRSRTLEVDTVVLCAGLSPLCELSQMIGGRVAHMVELGGTVPIHSPDLEATVDGVFLAGSIIGLEDAAVALAQGRLAGLMAGTRLGALRGTAATERLQRARDALAESRRGAIPFLPGASEGRRRVYELWRAAADDPKELYSG